MSVFSLIKRSRQQAKEHKQKQAEKTVEAPKEPYKHVPTHAAFDALSGAPSSFKEEDRPRIMEQNRRRTVMASSGLTRMSGVALPRVSSSLSHVTYPSDNATPMSIMPQAYSYSGGPPAAQFWHERNKSSVYSVTDGSRISLKGKEVDRSWGSGRNSPTFIQAESPAGSSNYSTSSQEDLEMKPVRQKSVPPAYRNPAAATNAHRLHPSSRRASDASERGDSSPKAAEQSSSSTDRAKPPVSMRGFSPIPAMTLPPMQLGNTSLSMQGTVASSAASTISSRSSSGLSSFNFNSNSAPFSAPMSGRSSAATTPAACVTPEPVWESVEEEEEEGRSYTHAPAYASAAAVAPSAMKQRDRRSVVKSKVTRFTELEKIESHTEKPAAAPTQVPNDKDVVDEAIAVEMVTATPTEVVSPSKSGKLFSKQVGSKPVKKSRWSIRSSAVAA
ncbi:uncharacterized protein LY79DRAFT_589159 [Colletotrichum navitas]|uniref:Uncharacterized protein n=1 Tax=Colletotrichum navitas TaxID=681940 RepID=A0AAD8Q1T3_9PEZI|nr:uncharacterized protein LY79DRAFT_589159 [Colletotrichum navitas]KAK1594307.1 hypothetical protein LY79DRAFT_589159 [Colletotrichum navitas]